VFYNFVYLSLQRVEEIKNKRQAHFILQRMKAAKKIQKAKDIRSVWLRIVSCVI
jgi:hypothetical protein